jgi:hypothetical protein
MDATMNAVSTDARRSVVPVREQRIRIWEDIIGNKHKDDPRNSDTFVYFGGLRYRKKSETFAIRERKGAKDAVALSEETLTADPKWRTDILRATYKTIPAHNTLRTDLRTSYWKQVRIAYYGVVVLQSHSPSVWAGGTSVLVNTRQVIVWSDIQTEECPHPAPVEGSVIHISHFSRGRDAILSDDFITRIGAGWRNDETDITHLLALRTILYETDDIIVYRPRQEGIKAKTIPQERGYRRDAQPHFPIVFLTDLSTKHGVPSVVKPLGVYGGDDRLIGRHNVGNIVRNLEASRERRGELKRLLAERIWETARVERMATAHGISFEAYLAQLSGDKEADE